MTLLTVALSAALAYWAAMWFYPPLLVPLMRLFVRVLYRFRIHGRERVPLRGPVLVLCNHVSYLDWVVVAAASPRLLTFVIWSGYYRNPVLRFLLSWCRHNTIRIDNRAARPRDILHSLQTIADALEAGKAIVVFPEGRLTRTGHLRPFGRGIERVLDRVKVPVTVIPACTDGLWGSAFSHRHGRIVWKWPEGFRRRLAVMFGKPMECGRPKERAAEGAKGVTPTAPELQQCVQEAMADCAVAESDRIPPVHRAFVRRAVSLRNLFRTCVVDNSTGVEKELTWGKMYVGAACMAHELRPRLGSAPRVGIWLPTGLGGSLANLSLAFLGKASVNLNYTSGTQGVRSAVAQAGLRAIVTARKFLARVPLDLPEDVERIYLEDLAAAIGGRRKALRMIQAVLLPAWAIERFVLRLPRHRPDDALTVIFSSGSTGEPKGVVLTHRNVGANAEGVAQTVGVQTSDCVLSVLPFFHSFGYTVCLWMPLVCGASTVYFPDPRQAKEVGDLCRRHRATLLLTTATFLRFYLRRCGADDFRSLRIIMAGAEKLPVKLQDEFEVKFGVRPLEGYGCTELSPVVSANLPDVVVRGVRQVTNTVGTVGQPILGVCVRAFEPEAMTPLPPGLEGVLCVRGPNVMAGYLDRPESTARVVFDGWYNTGDRGLIEETGFIRVTGRVSRFAKIAGEMVPLERIEEEMHDAVGSGSERVLAVAAVPDARRGERVIVLYLPELEGKLCGILEAIGKRGLPNLWLPDPRDCHRVDTMPVLGSGKLDLKRIGEMAAEVSRAE